MVDVPPQKWTLYRAYDKNSASLNGMAKVLIQVIQFFVRRWVAFCPAVFPPGGLVLHIELAKNKFEDEHWERLNQL